MSAMIWSVIWLLSAVILLTALVFITPVRFGITVTSIPQWRLTIVARLFGGLMPPLPVHDSARRRQRESLMASGAAGPENSRAIPFPIRGRAIIGVIRALPTLVAETVRPIQFRRLDIDADIGLTDPADTGQLFGMIAAVTAVRPDIEGLSVAVRPDFTGARASGSLDAELSFVPLRVLLPSARIAWQFFGWNKRGAM